MIDRKELKATARARMAQSAPSYWKIMLLWVLAALAPQLVLSLVSSPSDSMEKLSQLLAGGIDPELALRALELSMGQLVSSGILNIVLDIYQMVLSFGMVSYALRLFRGQPCGASDLFSGFSIVGRVVGQQLLVSLIIVACVVLLTIPVMMIFVICAAMDEVLGGIVLLAAALAVAAVATVIMLNYVLATLALADQPELGAMGAIQYGKNLIHGHKGQYILLSLSFLGWALLCSIPSGIFMGIHSRLGLSIPTWAVSLIDIVLMLPHYLWLMPYMESTIAGFYDALRQQKETLPQMPPL